MKTWLKTLLALMVVATSCRWAFAGAAEPVVGSWRIVSWNEVETESKAVSRPFGEHPVGMLTYAADGHMMLLFADPGRVPPAAPKATDAEAVQLYRTMVAYTGTYSVDGDKVTHSIETSWNQAWNGTRQVRFVEIKGDQLTLRTPPFISPFLGKEITSTLVWERVK